MFFTTFPDFFLRKNGLEYGITSETTETREAGKPASSARGNGFSVLRISLTSRRGLLGSKSETPETRDHE